MGFHKRYISNDQVIEMYRQRGMQAVYDWYTKGVDALVTETGLSSDVSELIGKDNDWNRMSDMISEQSINKGFN
jgi:hypothetical protein|tara:strand:+ start:1591 stop:1812 length:222 start_codon:yes stop_codon:yes gene_type:complete